MKTHHLIILLISLTLVGCSKEKRTKKQVAKTWTFLETPDKNINNQAGNVEDRTVFDGTETITFTEDGKFLVNDVRYGSWSYDGKTSVISIDQTPYQEYSCCGTPQTKMDWKILKLEKDKLVVKHSYYTYTDNQYSFK